MAQVQHASALPAASTASPLFAHLPSSTTTTTSPPGSSSHGRALSTLSPASLLLARPQHRALLMQAPTSTPPSSQQQQPQQRRSMAGGGGDDSTTTENTWAKFREQYGQPKVNDLAPAMYALIGVFAASAATAEFYAYPPRIVAMFGLLFCESSFVQCSARAYVHCHCVPACMRVPLPLLVLRTNDACHQRVLACRVEGRRARGTCIHACVPNGAPLCGGHRHGRAAQCVPQRMRASGRASVHLVHLARLLLWTAPARARCLHHCCMSMCARYVCSAAHASVHARIAKGSRAGAAAAVPAPEAESLRPERCLFNSLASWGAQRAWALCSRLQSTPS